MNELFVVILGIAAVFLVMGSVALLALGKMIDRYPMPNEEEREHSITSPVESTKIAVVLLWVLFVPGVWAVFQPGKYAMIAGITILFSVCLFMITALIFSFAVLSTMRGRKNAIREIEHRAEIDAALIHLEKTTGVKATAAPPSQTKKYRTPVRGSRFMAQFFKNF